MIGGRRRREKFTPEQKAQLSEIEEMIAVRTKRNEELSKQLEEREREIAEFRRNYYFVYALKELMFKQASGLKFLHHFLRNQDFGPGLDVPVPPREVSDEMKREFTMNGKIPFRDMYVDDTYPPNHPLVYTDEEIDYYITMLEDHEYYIYGGLDHHIQESFGKFPIEGNDILITGSITPWYEAMCLLYGAQPTTVDYNRILCLSRRIRTLTVEEQDRLGKQYDSALSISSFEHDGLGGYGDPIDPDGDLKAMTKLRGLVKPGGLVYLNVPCGPDAVLFNRQRTYGKIRLPMLLDGWEFIESYGFSEAELEKTHSNPLFVLRKPTAPDLLGRS